MRVELTDGLLRRMPGRDVGRLMRGVVRVLREHALETSDHGAGLRAGGLAADVERLGPVLAELYRQVRKQTRGMR